MVYSFAVLAQIFKEDLKNLIIFFIRLKKLSNLRDFKVLVLQLPLLEKSGITKTVITVSKKEIDHN